MLWLLRILSSSRKSTTLRHHQLLKVERNDETTKGRIRAIELSPLELQTSQIKIKVRKPRPLSKMKSTNLLRAIRPLGSSIRGLRPSPLALTLLRRTNKAPSQTLSQLQSIMSFSNANTGDKPSDPYKDKNKEDDVSIKEKVEDLSEFITACKFGMMTTRDGSSGALVSRCMALAAKVRFMHRNVLLKHI